MTEQRLAAAAAIDALSVEASLRLMNTQDMEVPLAIRKAIPQITKVVEIVESENMADQVAIMSLKYEGIQKIRALRPDWNIGLLSAKALGDLTKLDADFLAVNMGIASSGFLRRARKAGKPVLVWTVNTPVDISRMTSLGVDGIITDEPAMARRVLEDRADMSVAERLLAHTAVVLGRPPPKRTYRDESP